METILRFLNKKYSFYFFLFFFFGLFLLLHYNELDFFNSSPKTVLPLEPASADSSILSDLERRESLKLKTLHRTITQEISEAQTKGFNVVRLQAIADQALLLDSQQYRAAAIEHLNKLRLAIPQAKENFRPAGNDEDPSENSSSPRKSKRRLHKKR